MDETLTDVLKEFPGVKSLDDLFRMAYVFVFGRPPSFTFIRMDIDRWREKKHLPPYVRVYLEKQGL